MDNEDIYVLKHEDTGTIIAIADDFEYLNMMTVNYPAEEQLKMIIENHDLLRVKDKGD